MGISEPILLLHLVKLEENIANIEDIQIDRFISNVLINASNVSAFTVRKLLFDQEVDIFVSEDSETLKNKKVYELSRYPSGEYCVENHDDLMYPNPENTFDLIDRDAYIKKVVESSVTGIDDYIEFFAVEEVKFDEEPTEECCDCKEFED